MGAAITVQQQARPRPAAPEQLVLWRDGVREPREKMYRALPLDPELLDEASSPFRSVQGLFLAWPGFPDRHTRPPARKPVYGALRAPSRRGSARKRPILAFRAGCGGFHPESPARRECLGSARKQGILVEWADALAADSCVEEGDRLRPRWSGTNQPPPW